MISKHGLVQNNKIMVNSKKSSNFAKNFTTMLKKIIFTLTVPAHFMRAVDSEGNILYSYDTDYLGIRNNCPDWELIDEAVDNVSNETPSATKILRDGHLYIIVNEKEYTADGMLIR